MPSLKNSFLFRLPSDFLLIWLLRFCAGVSGLIAVLIAFFLLSESLPIFKTLGILRFFNDLSWHPTENQFNLIPMLWGSLFAMLGAVLIATPLGILSAVFCQFYAPTLVSKFYRQMVQLLAGIPSVVYGFWGLVVLVPLINKIQPPGASLLAGILILSIMILPTIMLTAEASLATVPVHLIRGAAALGLSRYSTLKGVIFPAAKSGLFTGIILETGRAIGETMAILMVCGNVVQTPKSLFEPIRTLTANIALEMSYATGTHRSALFVSGLMLILIVAILAGLAEILSRKKIYE